MSVRLWSCGCLLLASLAAHAEDRVVAADLPPLPEMPALPTAAAHAADGAGSELREGRDAQAEACACDPTGAPTTSGAEPTVVAVPDADAREPGSRGRGHAKHHHRGKGRGHAGDARDACGCDGTVKAEALALARREGAEAQRDGARRWQGELRGRRGGERSRPDLGTVLDRDRDRDRDRDGDRRRD